MKAYRFICSMTCLALFLPLLSHAEIYKWVENGTVRYSDTPPPANIKSQTIIKKKDAKKSEVNAATPAVEPKNKAVPPGTATKKLATPDDLDKDMQAARTRQQNAENEKNKKKQDEEQAKNKEQNCISARSSYETYKQGGRISKVNENGEKTYMGDNDIKSGLEKAQADMNEYCN